MDPPRFGEDAEWQLDEDFGSSDCQSGPEETAKVSIRLSRGKPKVNEERLDPESAGQNDKTFFLPTMNEETFIDHNCVMDPQGYPILPNGNTVYVRPPGANISNFGNVGFSKRTGTEYRSKGAWKLKRIYCLGVLSCDLPGCRWAGAPPTGRVVMSEWLEKNSHCRGARGTCLGTVVHIPCKQTLIRVDEHVATTWAVLRHRGIHDHPWPEAKKPDQLARDALKNVIASNPKAGAFALRIRKPNASQDSYESVLDIHPSLGNADRLRYYRKLMLKELNITPDNISGEVDDKFITDLFKWVKRGMLIISSSYLEGEEHFTFQSEWMQKRLLARNIDNQVYSTGLVSDVTYRFFRNGYLLSTSMYCEELARWVPIQLTWIRGLAEKYYERHFATLFRQFLRPDFTKAERDILVCNIVDFSAAQREGFVAAYWEVFGVCEKKVVLDKLQGCHEHYCAQVSRVKKNRHVVMADEESTFQTMCMDLIKKPVEGDPTHEEQIDALRRRFPKAKRWLDWWTMADVEAMLFPSRRPLLEDAPDGQDRPTKTTNAQESLHRLYYMLSEGKTSLMLGMVQLYSFIKVLEEDFDAVMRGVSIEYGSARKGIDDISKSLGWEKKRKRAPNPAKPAGDEKVRHASVNDGRPPDTTDGLLPELAKKKLGRPSGSVNIDRNPFSTYPSYRASTQRHLANRCWMAAALETLYALYSPLWHRGSSGKGTSLFTSLVKHFSARTTYELTQAGSIRGALTKAQTLLFTQAQNRSPRSFVEGEFASADLFIEMLLDPKANPNRALKGLFDLEEKRTLTCPSHPGETQNLTRVVHTINIRRAMFDENQIPHANVAQLLSKWTSTALQGVSGLTCKSCLAGRVIRHQEFVPVASDVEMSTSQVGSSNNFLYIESSTLGVPIGKAPPHLYFFLDVAPIVDEDEQQRFMATTDWPMSIFVSNQRYSLFARGYWNGSHYWCKVLKTVGGMVGVWLHNDLQNDGYARLVNVDPSKLSGPAPHTSWLMYSRCWTGPEKEYVNEMIDKIQKDYPHATGHPAFGGLSNLLESINTDKPISQLEKHPEVSINTAKPISQVDKHPEVQDEPVASPLPATIEFNPASSQGGP
ncbi:uncharacterized protein PGTG_15748 [Puccinia graminis f. sp. tritici CRL 75-36-700-3]|uniref:GCM domain-containing protein n=1 Tax=Puccinia graminis f. sp. tritici (strain CRL 75-36-700-3 / race SCCL) TaxID=418459 RepID=E3KZ74_PUCGT|nr:uncharacterized protein PGTG_15748 [Puccinia graminis f. sp. tritici CRL 75-36-700-3]EFP89599.2 hypothetical protein PGTG_15748 [Puccinia graminis f. sp. tritici CRL 75-36-700-3]